jgi:hypothetical protein
MYHSNLLSGQAAVLVDISAQPSTSGQYPEVSYRALGRQLSQYLWITTAPSSLNRASVVATAAHDTQNPVPPFVPALAGLV